MYCKLTAGVPESCILRILNPIDLICWGVQGQQSPYSTSTACLSRLMHRIMKYIMVHLSRSFLQFGIGMISSAGDFIYTTITVWSFCKKWNLSVYN